MSRALDQILLRRADEQVASAQGPTGRRRRDSWRSDIRNAAPAPEKTKKRVSCLGCGRPRGRSRFAFYCASCGERVRHGTSLEAVEIVWTKGSA